MSNGIRVGENGSKDLYLALPLNGKDEIRLLELVSSTDKNAGISLQLAVASLGEGPVYLALSYTWGPATYEEEDEEEGISSGSKHQVLCNGLPIKVTKNLYAFLLMARSNPELSAYRMWIDAICIDQLNFSEQTSQVSLMKGIFGSAKFVAVWLGDDDGDADKGFDLMRTIARCSRDDLDKISPENIGRDELTCILGPCGGAAYWNAIAKLFRRRYFSRVWIIQEVILARAITVFCGRYSVSWDDLIKTSHFVAVTTWTRWIHACSNHAYHHAVPTTLNYSKWRREDGALHNILYYLVIARQFRASRLHDKVYALFGVAESSVGKRRFCPDYEKSVADAYKDAAIQILKDSNDLHLLAHAEFAHDKFYELKELPSWVPDWSCSQVAGIELAGMPRFSAAGDVPRSLVFDKTYRTLSVKGTKLDDIILVGESKRDVLDSKPVPGWLAILEQSPLTYATGESRFEVFWRTLITNTAGIPAQYPASSEYGAGFSSWFRDRVKRCFDEAEAKYVLTLLPEADGNVTATSATASVTLPSLDSWYCLDHNKRIVGADEYETTYSHARFLRLFLTSHGYLGVGSESLVEQDSVWIIAGSCTPLLLREARPGTFKLVGAVYLHGFMDGRALKRNPNFGDVVIV